MGFQPFPHGMSASKASEQAVMQTPRAELQAATVAGIAAPAVIVPKTYPPAA